MKRPPRRPQAADHDGELAELASVIAEFSLDNNAHGWFRPAWRDGWNAIELATAVAEIDVQRLDIEDEIAWLKKTCQQRHDLSRVYWEAQDLRASTKMIQAAIRCLQALIARSDGGGEVYNAILVGPFSKLLPEEVFDLVLEHRCRDSIGTTAQLQGDANDRQRRAFSIAWNRGLYLAAYSLPPAVKPIGKLTVLK